MVAFITIRLLNLRVDERVNEIIAIENNTTIIFYHTVTIDGIQRRNEGPVYALPERCIFE